MFHVNHLNLGRLSFSWKFRLEPNNVKTVEAINRLENALVAKLENHLDLETDDIPESDEEVFLFYFLYASAISVKN